MHSSPFAANHNLASRITPIWRCSVDCPMLKKRERRKKYRSILYKIIDNAERQLPAAKVVLLIQPLWRTVWRFLKKLKIELLYDPAVPLLGIYPEKNMIRKDKCTPVFTAALFTIAKTWKQPECPLTEERKKM